MSATDLSHAALVLATIAIAGRIVLSLLPPGPPGFHGFADLPLTWAASHLLGSIALAAERDLFGAFGLNSGSVLFVAPWVLALAVRWITLPGGFVPRHTPRAEITSALARALAFAACVITIATSAPSIAVADLLAALCLCSAALRTARRAPLGTSAVIVSLSAVLALARASGRGDLSTMVLCTAGGAGFAIAWLRRADKRARMLAVLSSAGAALLGDLGWVFALAVSIAVVVRTAAPSRARTAAMFALAIGCAVLLSRAVGREIAFRALADTAEEPLSRLARIAIAACLLGSAAFIARRWRRAGTVEPIEPPRRELSALGLAAGIACAACAALGWLTPQRASLVAIAPLLPICALMIGLALVRSEQPFDRA